MQRMKKKMRRILQAHKLILGDWAVRFLNTCFLDYSSNGHIHSFQCYFTLVLDILVFQRCFLASVAVIP